MGFNFPNSPAVNDFYNAGAGLPTYRWNGSSWVCQGVTSDKTPIYTDGSTSMTAQLNLITPPVSNNNASSKKYVDDSIVALGGLVRYDASQSLTQAQWLQAQKNIYAAPLDALAYSGMQLNGSMEVSQQFGTTGVTSGYGPDGWVLGNTSTAVVYLQQYVTGSGIPFFPSTMAMWVQTAKASLAAGDLVYFYQNIEGYRVSRLCMGSGAAQPVTVAFWSSHIRTGTYSVALRNNGGTRSCVQTYTQNVSGVAEYKVVSFPPDTATGNTWNITNGIGLILSFAMAAGSTYTTSTIGSWVSANVVAATSQVNGVAATSDVFRINGVIVLPGYNAPTANYSPLIMRPFDEELDFAMRYWEKSYLYGTALGTTGTGNAGYNQWYMTTSAVFGAMGGMTFFKKRKRTSPTVRTYSVITGAIDKISDFQASDLNTSIADVSEQSFLAVAALAASASTLNVGFHWHADARL